MPFWHPAFPKNSEAYRRIYKGELILTIARIVLVAVVLLFGSISESP